MVMVPRGPRRARRSIPGGREGEEDHLGKGGGCVCCLQEDGRGVVDDLSTGPRVGPGGGRGVVCGVDATREERARGRVWNEQGITRTGQAERA